MSNSSSFSLYNPSLVRSWKPHSIVLEYNSIPYPIDSWKYEELGRLLFPSKIGLCIALAFTFPIMMHPVHDIVESRLKSSGWFQKLCRRVTGAEMIGLNATRMLMVAAMAILASFIPAFGAFISLVGSTACAMLAFVLPATFHLTLMGSHLKSWQRWLDYVILAVGVVFASYGTYDAVMGGSMTA